MKIVLVGLRGAQIEYGDTENAPVPRRTELVELYDEADAAVLGGIAWRVRDIAYLVLEDEIKVMVYLDPGPYEGNR